MILRDSIVEVIQTRESDGRGGFRVVSQSERTIDCKASFNTKPEVMTAYGEAGEQVLYVVTSESLKKEAIYLYMDKKYNMRFQSKNNRFFFSTLVEIK